MEYCALKYMGSKAILLNKGLGKIIQAESLRSRRFVDLFTGAGHVAHFAARNTSLPVVAMDLQTYGSILAGAVVERTKKADQAQLEMDWLQPALDRVKIGPAWSGALKLEKAVSLSTLIHDARDFSASEESVGPILRAYGGHYFSPTQALVLDHLLLALPQDEVLRKICLAALICVASRCAASPGHTAQPFRPTRKGGRYIREAWEKDPGGLARHYLGFFCNLYARRRGQAFVSDAVSFSTRLKPQDLVFVDPPYSAVQYSRFYHVLETVAVGYCGEVSGSGRYPSRDERPQSDFSKITKSLQAFEALFEGLGAAGVTAIVTFPSGNSSNGISGGELIAKAMKYFRVKSFVVNGSFSTLGGNNSHREPKQNAEELLMILKPRRKLLQSRSQEFRSPSTLSGA